MLDRITVTDATNSSITHEINYDSVYEDYTYEGTYDTYNLNGDILIRVTDAEGNETNYTYYYKRASRSFFSFTRKNEDSYNFYYADSWGDHGRWEETFYGHPNYTALLKEIEYPTGGKTKYEYGKCIKNCGPGGSAMYFRFYKAYELSKDNVKKNIRTVYYDNAIDPPSSSLFPDRGSFDGFPIYYKGNWIGYEYDINTGERLWTTPDTWEVNSRKGTNHYLSTDGYDHFYTTYRYKYDYDFLLKEKLEKEWQRNGLEEIKILFEYNEDKQMLKKSAKRYPSDGGVTLLSIVENFEYDSDANGKSYNDLIGYWDVQNMRNGWGVPSNDEHKTAYTYHPTYHYLLSKEYKRDAGHKVKEEYTPTADGKSIEWNKVYEKVGSGGYGLKKKTWYSYDAYGNMVQQREYPDLSTGDYICTEFSYTDNDSVRINNNAAFDGVYLTRKWTTDIRDADGNPVAARGGNSAGTIDETYSYDWFGNLKKYRDGTGNEDTYEYDRLNRITKKTNPDLSTVNYYYDDIKNTVTVEDELNSSKKYAYDEFGNFRYEMDLDSNDIVKKQIWGINGRIKYEQSGDKGCKGWRIDAAGRLSKEWTYEQYVWFDSALPLGAQISAGSGAWKWKYGFYRDNDAYHYSTNSPGLHEHYFENADEKLSIESGDYIYVYFDVMEDNDPSEIMLQFHCYEDNSWEHRAYWGSNIINLGTDGTESRKHVGAIPNHGPLKVLADDIGLAGKKVDGMKFTLYDGQCEFGQVGLYKSSDDSNKLEDIWYYYDYAEYNDERYDKVKKEIRGLFSEDSPGIINEESYDRKTGFLKEKVRKSGAFTETFENDYLGNITEIRNSRAYDESWSDSFTSKMEYDFEGKEVKNTNVLGNYIEKVYDGIGRLKSIVDYKGSETTFTYDKFGRLIEEKIPFEETGGATYHTSNVYYYDRNSNKTGEEVTNNIPGQNESFSRTEYEYDNRNNLTKVITYNEGVPENYTQYYYDSTGNIRRMYTGLNSPLTINGLDDITAVGDSNYSVTRYDEYDANGRVGRITDALGKTEQFTYDINGNMVSKLDRKNNTITKAYDGLNRIVGESVATPDGSGNRVNTYEYHLTGLLKSVNNGEKIYSYDRLGRLEKEVEAGEITKEYSYDANNNRKSLLVKVNGVTKISTTYTYDKLDRLHEVYEAGQLKAAYTYDDNGNRQSLTYDNGNSTQYQYNLANKLKVLTNKNGSNTLSQYTYSYYLDGNQSDKTETVGNIRTDYVYDGLGRLVSETEDGNGTVNSIAYTYDDYNNRETMLKDGVTTTYSYDKNNRLTTETKAAGDTQEITRYGYDDNGNQINKRTETIKPVGAGDTEFGVYVAGESVETGNVAFNEYDGFNRLIKVTSGDMTATYTYNGDGLRSSKTVNGATTTHVWDGGQIALELDGSSSVLNKYLRGVNLITAEDSTGLKQYYLYNGHGDVVQLTSNSGSLVNTYDYDAFGNEKNPDPSDSNVFRYCGEYFDKETGTIYLRARYYVPTIGRFITEDSYSGNNADPLSLNLYTYCQNNPVLCFLRGTRKP